MVSFPVLRDADVEVRRARASTRKEKKALLPFLLLTPVFFGGGAAFAYFVAMPWALHFLLSFEGDVGGVQQEALPGVGNYLSFSTRFLFGFGVAFLLPILLMILERAGLVTREQLARSRRYAIVGAAGGLGGADPAGRGVDAAAAGAALRAVRVRDPGDPAHALARGAQGSGSAAVDVGGPDRMRARKRHRGGGGLAVPGPFKRIARAGGQKVTIRTAQRRFFAQRFRVR